MGYYENQLKSKTHINNLSKLDNIWKCCDFRQDDIKNSSWNEHMKKHAGFANTTLGEHKTSLLKASKSWNIIYWLTFLPPFLTLSILI